MIVSRNKVTMVAHNALFAFGAELTQTDQTAWSAQDVDGSTASRQVCSTARAAQAFPEISLLQYVTESLNAVRCQSSFELHWSAVLAQLTSPLCLERR
jgi:hypothetical protein